MFDIAAMSGGAVHSGARVWLRLEGIAALLLAITLYAQVGASWIVFAALFFVPDLSFAGYLAGPRVGAAIYNVAHSFVGPLIVAATVVIAGAGAWLPFAFVWVAHIGFDRALGYGLKYSTAFSDTHLGQIGRNVRAESRGPANTAGQIRTATHVDWSRRSAAGRSGIPPIS